MFASPPARIVIITEGWVGDIPSLSRCCTLGAGLRAPGSEAGGKTRRSHGSLLQGSCQQLRASEVIVALLFFPAFKILFNLRQAERLARKSFLY